MMRKSLLSPAVAICSNPYSITDSVALAQRQFSLIAGGMQARPQTIRLVSGYK